MDDLGHVCLTDFGMAKILRTNELALSFCGTPEYLAPEILQVDDRYIYSEGSRAFDGR